MLWEKRIKKIYHKIGYIIVVYNIVFSRMILSTPTITNNKNSNSNGDNNNNNSVNLLIICFIHFCLVGFFCKRISVPVPLPNYLHSSPQLSRKFELFM